MAGAMTPETEQGFAALIEVSHALGDPRLTLHGGGNTSIKGRWREVTQSEIDVLLVKGSGHPLATIDRDGFAPLRLDRLRELLPPVTLDPLQLADELRCALLDSQAPDPSVETLVHALLPHEVVLHSHADAILAITNSPNGRALVEDLFGPRILVVDYAMPGPELGIACAQAWADATDRHAVIEGLIVQNHGLFAVGSSPSQAFDRHSSIVAAAEERISRDRAVRQSASPRATTLDSAVTLARLRARLSALVGHPIIVHRDLDPVTGSLLAEKAVVGASVLGPLTPDHVTWSGPFPLLGNNVDAYAEAYRTYVEQNRTRTGLDVDPRDPAPRVIIDSELGLLTVGRTGRESAVVRDIARHTLSGIADALALGGYRPASPDHVFDLEYWAPQQAKRNRADGGLPLRGRVAVVTGAASGIGRACAAELLAQGACVVGWDRSPEIEATFEGPEWLGLTVDVSEEGSQRQALIEGVDAFGGLDILVPAAGIFPTAQHLHDLDREQWRRAMAINTDSVAELFALAHPLLQQAPAGGRVCVVASKNVIAPGPGAAAYSASKAALTQLSRVAALEWADDGIRVNMVHPDAVFDTALWTPELLQARAEHYGMTVDDYKRRNLLHAEVRSADVGVMVRAMADDTFRCTTGAQVPVDGGNERVI